MEKKLFLIAALMMLPLVSITAGNADHIVLWKTNGEKITLSFSERPKITFGKGEVIITTNNNEVAYPANELARCTYESLPDGIDHIGTSASPTLTFYSDGVIITGLPPTSSVAVYNAAGQLLGSLQTNEGGKVRVSTAAFTTGVYIVKTSVGNFKIRKS